jgi:hypothetical protein
MRKILFILLLVLPGFVVAQQIDRTQVKGVITAPIGEDLEGISVYNISSQKGTVTNQNGEFTIEVGINDRVLFTALQFQKFTIIIDEGIVENKQMRVYVNPAVMQLDEIIVRPHDLTGNIIVDASRIKTVDLDLGFTLSWEEMEFGYEFSDDRSSGVKNTALDRTSQIAIEHIGTINLLGLVGLLGETFFRNKDRSTQKLTPLEKAQIADASYIAVYQRFANSYFTENLKLSKDQIEPFLYFISDNGFTLDLLKENNELKLMDFLEKQSEIYLATTE